MRRSCHSCNSINIRTYEHTRKADFIVCYRCKECAMPRAGCKIDTNSQRFLSVQSIEMLNGKFRMLLNRDFVGFSGQFTFNVFSWKRNSWHFLISWNACFEGIRFWYQPLKSACVWSSSNMACLVIFKRFPACLQARFSYNACTW